MSRVAEAVQTLEVAVSLLEEAIVGKERERYAAKLRAKPAPQPRAEDVGGLFAPAELSDVKARLDDAIEQLENALEGGNGPR